MRILAVGVDYEDGADGLGGEALGWIMPYLVATSMRISSMSGNVTSTFFMPFHSTPDLTQPGDMGVEAVNGEADQFRC